MNRHTDFKRLKAAGGSGVLWIEEAFGVVRRHLVALCITGIVAACAGWAIDSVLPKKYTSLAYLRIDEAAARSADALMSSASILDSVLAKFRIAGDTIEE